jgi:hypothetical protein
MPADLTDAERSVWAAFPSGTWVDLRAGDDRDDLEDAARWGSQRLVRAKVLTALLLGAAGPQPGSFPAVRLRGARIAGRLDVMGATVGFGLVCEYCWFDTAPRFVEATTKTVRLVNCRLAGFNGTRMRTEGILNLYRTKVGGALLLDQATIAGQACLGQAVVDGQAGEAVAAHGLVLSGDLDCTEMISRGPVRLGNARIDGSVQLIGAQICSSGGRALDATNAVIGAGLDGSRMIVDGETRLRHTRIAGSLRLPAAQLRNPDGVALGAGGLTVQSGMWCPGLSASGEMRMVGARLDANLTLADAGLCNPGGLALNLERAVLFDLDAPGLIASAGSVSLIGAEIASRVNLAGARLAGGHGTAALSADGAKVNRRLILDDADITGAVSASSANLGSRVLLRRTRIDNPGGPALRLPAVDVAVDLACDGMAATGQIDVSGARIGRRLDFTGATVNNPGRVAVDAKALRAGEVCVCTAEPIRGIADFSHARLGILYDDPLNWPDEIRLGGATYEALEPQLPAQRRLQWLALDQGSRSPQPYEQLAVLYTTAGYPAEARRVLYAAERLQRTAKPLLVRAWGILQDITVGYGYRPMRAALWLLALLTLGSVIYATAPPPPLDASAAPHFNAVIYTLDLLMPVVNLGQKYEFNPSGAEQWLSYILIAAGWVLATTIATSVARILTRR